MKRKSEWAKKWLRPLIRDYHQRNWWWMKNRGTTTWAFYYNGRNLYVEPLFRPPTSFYSTPWFLIPEGSPDGYLLWRNRRNKCHRMVVQVIEHSKDGCTLEVGSSKELYFIPTMGILYLAVRYDLIFDRLIQLQPLPCYIVPKVWTAS